jgi:putative ABC transport system substrate-binding protein
MQQLSLRGYVEGRDIVLDCVATGNAVNREVELLSDLIARHPDVLITSYTAATRAAQRLTQTIPIVMVVSADAVREGLVESLSRPGSNTTGNTLVSTELIGKRLATLREIVPEARRWAVLARRDADPVFLKTFLADLDGRANVLGLVLHNVFASNAAEITSAVAEAASWKADAMIVVDSPLFTVNGARLAELAIAHRLPTVSGNSFLTRDGLLLSYSGDVNAAILQTADTVDRLLKGAKPADLPVQVITRFNLIINAKTAKALGVSIPPTMLTLADEVIE